MQSVLTFDFVKTTEILQSVSRSLAWYHNMIFCLIQMARRTQETSKRRYNVFNTTIIHSLIHPIIRIMVPRLSKSPFSSPEPTILFVFVSTKHRDLFLLQNRKTVIHGVIAKFEKSDWLKIQNEWGATEL